MNAFEITFEELPSYKSSKGLWSGMHDGIAEISFDDEGEWLVTSISLKCDNHKFGKDAYSEYEQISQAFDKELWAGLTDALSAFYGARIEAKIADHLDEMEVPYRSDYSEHSTLHRVAQGV